MVDLTFNKVEYLLPYKFLKSLTTLQIYFDVSKLKILFSVSFNNSCLQQNSSNQQYECVLAGRNTTILDNAKLSAKLGQIKSSKDMVQFLDKNVYWNFVCAVNLSGKIIAEELHSFEQMHRSSNISSICVICQYDDNGNNFSQTLRDYYSVFVLMGLISLFGNLVAIVHQTKSIARQRSKNTKEKRLYNILVLNLCFSDLLMAVYLIICPIALVKLKQVSFALCNALGIISVLSIQVSVSCLAIITTVRLFGLLFPYKYISIKATIILLVMVWLVWIVIVALPLFNEVLFAHAFTYGIKTNCHNRECVIPLTEITEIVEDWAEALNSSNEPHSQIIKTLRIYKKNEVALQVVKSFNLVNFNQSETIVLGQYNPNRGCTLEVLISASDANSFFSLILLLFNLVGFLYIAFAYFVIFKNIYAMPFKSLLPCVSRKRLAKRPEEEKPRKIKNENKHIYIRIFIVVLTDLFCGIPVCAIGIWQFFNGLVSDCFEFQNTEFRDVPPLAVLILFPINSVINPYIYSFHLWRNVYKRCKQLLQGLISR